MSAKTKNHINKENFMKEYKMNFWIFSGIMTKYVDRIYIVNNKIYIKSVNIR